MAKEIRLAQNAYPTPETHQYSDELTVKEMLKKYPKKAAKKKEALLKAMQKGIKKKKSLSASSKRTTPGSNISTTESSPAHVHREGARWLKTLTKQALNQRVTTTRRTTKKK
jgi:hypothetical protein